MAANALVDAGVLVALLNRRDAHHRWAVAQARRFPPPWRTCESALSEAFHLLGAGGAASLTDLIRRGAVAVAFDLGDNMDAVLTLMQKYADVPASLADVCLVRMTEVIDNPILLTTDGDFRVYRRHGRRVIPCALPN
jgi:predicted nucleic acid-binding protein